MRLDSALTNELWKFIYADSTVLVLPRFHSDHDPLLLNPFPQLSCVPMPFRCLFAWTDHPNFENVFTNSWITESTSIANATANVQKAVVHWNKTVFGNVRKRKNRLLARIQGIQRINSPPLSL